MESKVTASFAHSVRNPITSIKMRLYSKKLKEVVVNLLINSYQAMERKNGTIFIHEREEDRTSFGRAAVIEIYDNGKTAF